MHKLTVTLKQHTPLIHFQHSQEGATLRASEVKAMFDKFLIENEFSNEYDEYKECLLNAKDGLKAFDYKLSIRGVEKIPIEMSVRTSTEKYNTDQFPLILSNMGGKDSVEELANFSFFKNVELTFITRNKLVYEIIEHWVDLFFASRNFGQRKDKGFGSFSVVKVGQKKVPFPVDDIEKVSTLSLHTPMSSNYKDLKKIFEVIDFYWKVLKSGVNYTNEKKYPERYIKSFLWIYLDREKETWEKRFIKEQFDLISGEERKHNPNNRSFARAILGLPDKFEYIKKGKTISISQDKKDENGREIPKEEYIDRIPSPIVFKPIFKDDKEVNIYVLIDFDSNKRLKQSKYMNFVFSYEREIARLPIKPSVIDLRILIKEYNKYLMDLMDNILNMDKDSYMDKYDIDQDVKWFVPKDFRWNNIVNYVEIK